MDKVIVYQVTPHIHYTYPGEKYFQHYGYDPETIKNQLVGDTVLIPECVEIILSPIKEYRWANGERILAVLPEKFREIIGIEVDKYLKMEKELARMIEESKKPTALEKSLLKDISGYRSMTFYQRLKFLFSGRKR